MQWLIDLIQEWVQAQGYLTTSFVDRGDPLANDFVLDDFTTDNAWRDLDLSSIVPAGAKAVVMKGLINSGNAASRWRFRKNGNVNANANITDMRTQVAEITVSYDVVTPIDADRIIEYRVANEPWNNAAFTVKGWWL